VNELGLQVDMVAPWFVVGPEQEYTRVAVPVEYSATWGDLLRDAVRRCYISDQRLQERAQATQSTPTQILAAKLPEPGSVMSGDFGEIVGYIYLASREDAANAIGPKRWRLKQDRTKAAPGSDVVQLIVPQWPQASAADRVICAEVKAKATDGNFSPIARAIEGSQKDRTSRLSRTLVWLRERALNEDIGSVTLPQLERFINATEFPSYVRSFHAIAVICSGFVDAELESLMPADIPNNCALVVISIPDLRNTYTAVYEAVLQSAAVNAAVPGVIA
jgi:hypothetical protein